MEDETSERPITLNRSLGRRDFLRLASLGVAAVGAGSLLSACGGTSPAKTSSTKGPTSSTSGPTSSTSQAAASSTTSKPGGLAAYSNKNLDLYFYLAELQAVKRQSAKLGYHFDTTNANGDASTQFNDWNSFLVQKPAFLISDPINTSNLIPLTAKAKSDNVPVAIIDTPLTGGTVDFTIAFDNTKGGELQGQKMVELLKKRYGRPKGTVLNTYGDLTAQVFVQRKTGFDNVMKKYPDIQVVERPTKTLPAQMHAVVAAALAQYPKLDGINSPTDGLTIDAISALKAAKKLLPSSDPKHIFVTTMDGDSNGIYWIEKGWVDADVSQDPVAYGEIAVEMMAKYSVHGKPVPLGTYTNSNYVWEKAEIFQSDTGPRLNVPAYFIDKGNANDPRQWGNVVAKKWGIPEPR